MGNGTKPTQRDGFTGYQVNVSSDHAYIHQGKGFNVSGKSGSVASAGTFMVSFTTPANKYVHFRPAKWSTTANVGELRLAEGSTVAGGSATTIVNRNRNKAAVSGVAVSAGATLTLEGTVILTGTCGIGGNPASSGGGGDGENEEFVLKPGTAYSLTFQNVGATTATVFYYSFFWYEEEQGA